MLVLQVRGAANWRRSVAFSDRRSPASDASVVARLPSSVTWPVAMAPKLTKRELERERALEQQQQQQQQQEEPPSANAYGLQPLATGAQPPVMMGDDAAAAMRGTATPLAVGLMHPSASPAPQQAVNVYQFGEHPPPEELGLVVSGPDHHSRRCFSAGG